MNKVFYFLMIPLALLMACGGPKQESTEEVEEASQELMLSRQQMTLADMAFGPITRELLSFDIRAKGKIILPPENDAIIGPHIDGTVASIEVRGGDRVHQGQVMATLASPYILKIQQEYISVRNERQLRKQEFERQSMLRKDNINAEKALEAAKFNLADINAKYQSLRMQMELLHFSIPKLDSGIITPTMDVLSIVNGQVEEIYIKVGEYVETNEPMFRVINKHNLYLELRVFEKDIPFIEPGQRVTFSLSNMGDKLFEAKVLSVGQFLEEDARTLQVIAQFRNQSTFIIPGMFASATIHTDEAMVDALPEEAVVQDPDAGAWIYYTTSLEADSVFVFHKLPVKTGFMEDDLIQVTLLDSLPSGARIVTSGTYYLKDQ